MMAPALRTASKWWPVWAAVTGHITIVLYLAAPFAGLGERPISNVDYTAHFFEAVNAASHLRLAGRLWGYNPFWMAGYLEGIIGIVDNKAILLLIALVPKWCQALAFNASVLLGLSAPPLALAAAMRDDEPVTHVALSACAASVATFTIPLNHFFWIGGGLSFFVGSALSVPAIVIGARTLASSAAEPIATARAAVLSFVASLIHPGAAIVIGSGLMAAALTTRFPLRVRLIRLLPLALALALPNVMVVMPLLEVRSQLRPVAAGPFLQGGWHRLSDDLFHRILRPKAGWDGGPGGLVALGVLGAFGWRRDRSGERAASDAVRAAIVSAGVVCLVLAYASSWFSAGFVLQPYRFLIPMAFLLCVLAGRGLARLAGRAISRHPLAIASICIVVYCAAGGARVLLPLSTLAAGHDVAERDLVDFLSRAAPRDGRVLVESVWTRVPAFPGSERRIEVKRFALLPLEVENECLGYQSTAAITAERYAAFGYGKMFGSDLERLSSSDLRTLLGRYAVAWIVGCEAATKRTLARFTDVLEFRHAAGECTVFAVHGAETSRALEGSARVEAGLDRIAVHDAAGQRVILKYHWTPTLLSFPSVPIEEAAQPGSPVGFIAVYPQGRRDLVIYSEGGQLDGDSAAN